MRPGTVASSTPPGARMRCEGRESRAHVVDELQRLRDDRTVEGVVGDLRSIGEVGDDRRLRVSLRRHEDVHLLDTPPEAGRVVGRGDLEHAPANVGGVGSDEALDVHAIDRRPALEAPVGVDRRDAPEVTEVERPAPSPVHVRAPKRPQPAP